MSVEMLWDKSLRSEGEGWDDATAVLPPCEINIFVDIRGWFNTYPYRNSHCAFKTILQRLISAMGLPILVRWPLYIESGPSPMGFPILVRQALYIESGPRRPFNCVISTVGFSILIRLHLYIDKMQAPDMLSKVWMKVFIYSQTVTVALVKFGNGYVISSYPL